MLNSFVRLMLGNIVGIRWLRNVWATGGLVFMAEETRGWERLQLGYQVKIMVLLRGLWP